MIYLDHNATTPVRPEVAEAISRALVDLPGNPSSVHAAGRRARQAVEEARQAVAGLCGGGVLAEEIVFTSGGTEGDHLAIRGLGAAAARAGRRRHVVTSALEHPAVLGATEALAAEGFTVARVQPSARGELAPAALEAALGDEAAVVTLALANHEIGNLYPLAALGEVARRRGALVHTDAVQAAGKVPLELRALGVDAATISAHKLGGPKGAGAVFVRRGLDLPPLAAGGHQERGRRPGTENVAAIVGFGVACRLAAASLHAERARLAELRGRLEAGLRALPGARLYGTEAADGRVAGTTCAAFAGAPGQLVAIGLDLEGICVSTGAACTSGALRPSPVLLAMGEAPDAAAEGLRVSLGWTTTAADVARLLEALPGVVARVRAAGAARGSAAEGLALAAGGGGA